MCYSIIQVLTWMNHARSLTTLSGPGTSGHVLEAWMPVSRRTFLSAGATLLASIGASAVLPGGAAEAAPADPKQTDLALYRPVAVSSTDYAPTPGSFAVDKLAQVGVKGSGWRAAAGDPQWISVDLQAPCRVEAVTLVFE